jgi:hypothetical protein
VLLKTKWLSIARQAISLESVVVIGGLEPPTLAL